MAELHVRIDTGKHGMLPAQRAIVHSDARIRVLLGGFASGKTQGGALTALTHGLQNGWTPAYGQNNPTTLIVSSTVSVLKHSAMAALRELCPPELILEERKSPDIEWTLINGHKYLFKAPRSATGLNASAVWLDEAHLIRSQATIADLQARVRDPKAESLLFLVTGLPERGVLSDAFEGHDDDPNRILVFANSADNKYLPAEVVEQMRRSFSVTDAQKYIGGSWVKPEGQVFHGFDPSRNLHETSGNPQAPVTIGFDVGDQSSVVFGQEHTIALKRADGTPVLDANKQPVHDKALRVIDELAPVNKSVAEICREIKATGWKVLPKHSAICVDPTIRRDELDAIKKAFPRVKIIRKSRKNRADSVEKGYSEVNRAFGDADGNVRLSIHRKCSVLTGALPKIRRSPSGKVHAQDQLDHAPDALRYLVGHVLPTNRAAHKTHGGVR